MGMRRWRAWQLLAEVIGRAGTPGHYEIVGYRGCGCWTVSYWGPGAMFGSAFPSVRTKKEALEVIRNAKHRKEF